MTVAATTHKQNDKYQPCAVTATVVCIVVKQVVKHKRLPPKKNRFFCKNLFVLHYGKMQKSVTMPVLFVKFQKLFTLHFMCAIIKKACMACQQDYLHERHPFGSYWRKI